MWDWIKKIPVKVKNGIINNSGKIAVVTSVVACVAASCVLFPPAIPFLVSGINYALPTITAETVKIVLISVAATSGVVAIGSGGITIGYAENERIKRELSQRAKDEGIQEISQMEAQNVGVGSEIAEILQRVATQNAQITSLIAKIEKMESDTQIRNHQDVQTRIADAARIDAMPGLTAKAVANLLAENPNGFYAQEQNQHINNSRGAQPRRKVEQPANPSMNPN